MQYLDTETGYYTDDTDIAIAITGNDAVTPAVDVEIAELVIAGILVPVLKKAA
jgi:hypothetical protein